MSGPRHILIVEDYEDLRTLFVTSFRRAGFDVAEAGDGQSAIEQATSRPPDAILMDLMLPIVDGWDAIRAIRAKVSGRPYILAVSASLAEGGRQDAYDAGCDDFVTKPIDPTTLIEIVRAALRA